MAGNAAPDFHRGRRIGKYEILTRLSVGGMAELYLAYLPGPGGFKKFVAVKQILPDIKADDSFVKMFLDEARITAAFNHANIGQVFDLGEEPEGGELYLAMEFIAGQNLEQVMKRAAKTNTPIPVGFAARAVRDACLALHYAHTFKDPTGQAMGVVHRDVSPKNVMVTYTGQVKMIDFGIAKARGRLNRTQVGVVRGTSGYMAPEQVKNEPLDGRCDLFAAGVMLHEMLCGRRLFSGPTDAAMMLKIVDEEAADPTSLNPQVTPELAQAVLTLLNKRAAKRFATGKDAARAIEQSGVALFDDEQMAEVMNGLFADRIAITRSLLERADEGDVESVSRAVEGLSAVEEEPKRGTGDFVDKPQATPRPSAPRRNVSSQRLPKVSSTGAAKAAKPTTGVNPAKRRPSPSKVDLPAAEPDDARPASPRPSAKRLNPVRPSSRQLPPASEPETEATQAPEEPKGGLGGLVAVLVVLLVLAGAGWAVTFGPLKDHAQALLKADETPPPDTSAHRLDPTSAGTSQKPAWLLEKEKAEARLAEERARQKEIEEAMNDPERQKLLQDIQAQLQQLNALEEEQRALKIEAKQGKATGEANSKKIDDLQKQIDDLKSALQTKQTKAGGKGEGKGAGGEAEVTVVKDSDSAKKAALGYLTLRTYNPDSCNVSFDGSPLGSTPLTRVPFEVGRHQLKVIDGDGRARLLSISIEAGKTLQLQAVDVSSLPLAP